MDHVWHAYRKYATFTGRAERKEFWYFTMFVALVYLAPFFILVPFDESLRSEVAVVAGVFLLGSLLPSIAVTVRRLHDTGRSGAWWFLSFVPIFNLVLIVYLATSGTSGDNEYGPRPAK